jgi:uncharacterized paraquat-inducible protein A
MLLYAAILAAATRNALMRQCAECGMRQVFPPSRIAESVSCTRCGASIPPRKQRVYSAGVGEEDTAC